MTQPNIDNILSSLNRFITLPQLDRSSYASDFSIIRDELIKKLRESDEVFNKLYNGTCMAGTGPREQIQFSKNKIKKCEINILLLQEAMLII